ncbi:uncharacterized protein LOC101679005 isoform X2 [Mustela putorius furo]|uniref:Uncharacterized protein LOC101679005 isoform X2 n=1 Tax=Mustela putorius furo TaxID=9669 RepID=A0A8U0NX07_MUSPF|nr:uncharacterized protein LOC101679005 isoform X2 [Mustela putorius furo]
MLRQVPPGWKVLKLLHLELFKHEDVGIFDDAYPMWITTIWLLGILYLKEGDPHLQGQSSFTHMAFSGVSLLSGRNTSSPVRSAFAAPVVSNLMSSADLANGPSFPSSSGQPGITTEHPPPALIDRLLLLLVLSTERPQTRQERGKANGKNSFPLFFENSFTFKRRQSETSLTRAGYENSSQVLVLVIKIFVIVLGFLSWCWIRRKKAKEHVT